MKLELSYKEQVETYNLDELASIHSGVIKIGQKCKQVWNTIAIDSETVDPFQCHLIGSVGGPWRLNNGQNRTECPKGLLSSKLIPCNNCLGRCVNLHPGHPKYYQRDPQTPTLINGKSVGEWGTEIQAGDIIAMGDATIKVCE